MISTEEELPEGTGLVVNYVDPESDDYTDLSQGPGRFSARLVYKEKGILIVL